MEILSHPATIWFVVGTILMLSELVIPGVFVLFFGLGAWITSFSTYLFEPSLPWQFIIFAVSSVLFLIILRKYFLKRIYKTSTSDPDEEFIGKTATVINSIEKDNNGKVDFRGTTWNASSENYIASGTKVKIIGKESICLLVEKEE